MKQTLILNRSLRYLLTHSLRALACCLAVTATLSPSGATAQTVLTNGGSLDGALTMGTRSSYSIPAQAGAKVIVQLAEISGGAAFTPLIELWSPDGGRLASASHPTAPRVEILAEVSGNYTLEVSDASGTGSGSYRVWLAQVAGEFTVPVGDEGGSLTNGVSHQGSIEVGDIDLWTITADPGDWIAVQVSELTGGAGFAPGIELLAPDGTSLGISSGAVAARIDAQARVNGTYTVLVRDMEGSGAGTYQLQLARLPGDAVTPSGDEGGSLADATDSDGTISTGDLDRWSFVGSLGDRVVVQLTELSGGAGFAPQIELFGPGGERKAWARGATEATVDVALESAGTYALLVSDGDRSGAGNYRLRLTRTTIGPAESNTLTNGLSALGSVASAGETNRWSFTASAGESLVIRVGETATGGFVPWVRLHSSEGVLLRQDFSAAAAEVTMRATNSGTFVVVVSDGSSGRNQTGNYRIELAKSGSPVVLSAADEGGSLTNGAAYLASIENGDIDTWTFTANTGEAMIVRAGETVAGSTLYPFLRLYGPDGSFLAQDFNAGAAEVSVRATNSGTFTVVMADGNSSLAGIGNYRISLARTGSQPLISTADEGGSLTNGTTYAATIETGDIDAWTFTANAGESMVVRAGETVANSTLYPWLRLYGPNGALLNQDFNAAAAEVTTRATNSGTFMVVVADGNSSLAGIGNYRLSLSRTGTRPAISASDEGGPLTNGTTYLATIEVGDLDAWTIDAAAGETILVRAGETVSGSGLYPWLRLYGPNGALLHQDFNAAAAEVTARATNSGTFTIVMADGNSSRAGTGNYRLTLSKTGSHPVISTADEGGLLTNGTTFVASIEIGDLDAWTIDVEAGETILVRAGETVAGSTLYPWLRLYGPNGVLLHQDFNAAAAEVTARATNSGTFTIVVGDGTSGLAGIGNYRLSLARTVGALLISDTDEGGSMTGTNEYVAAIEIGDLDAWTFTACAGDVISLSVTESVSGSPLYPWLRLYGANGAQLRSVSHASSAAIQNLIAPASGTYRVVVSDGTSGLGASGNYRLAVNGLTDGMKLCPPAISGDNAFITGIGGNAAGPFTLLSTVQVTDPLHLWTAIRTNFFDLYGVFTATNPYSAELEPRRFFYLQVP